MGIFTSIKHNFIANWYKLWCGGELQASIKMLENANSEIRLLGIEKLYSVGWNKPVTQYLIQALRDRSEEVRLVAVAALRFKFWDESVVEPLIELLEDKNEEIHQVAAEILCRSADPRIIKPLIKRFQGSPELLDRSVCEVIDVQNIQPYILALKNPNKFVRYAAVTALKETASDHAVKPLIEALDDTYFLVRFAAIEALAKIKDMQNINPLIDMLGNYDSLLSAYVTSGLSKYGESAAIALTKSLSDKDEWVRYDAIESLAGMSLKGNLEILIHSLNDKSGAVRASAAQALGKLGDARAVEPLIYLLEDTNYRARDAAIQSLEKIGDERAVEPLIKLLKHKSFFTRWEAARVLGELKDPRALPTLEWMKEHDKSREQPFGIKLKKSVVSAIVKIKLGKEPALEDFDKFLKDKDWYVRLPAVYTLGKFKSLQSSEILEEIARKDRDVEVRAAANYVLNNLREN